jgi:hypothetical protein
MQTVNINLVRSGEDCQAVVLMGGRTLTLDPRQIALVEGVVRMAVPLDIEVPAECVEVERHLPPDREQLRLAVESLDAAAIQRVLIREQMTALDEAPGVTLKRAVALVLTGDTGEEQ